MWLWLRALVYMFIVAGGWLILLPACLLLLESGSISIQLRSPVLQIVSIIVFTSGAVLALWAGYHLIQYGHGTPLPLDPTSRLVATGPYQYVRNPQAIAMLLMVLAEVLAIPSNWIWLMLLLTLLYLEGLVAPLEHRQLLLKFGSAYQAYAAQVPRWLPRLPSQ